MKSKVMLFVREFRQSVARNPIEALLAAGTCVLWLCLLREETDSVLNLLRFAPVIFLLACILHAHSGHKGIRVAYYLSPLLWIPFYWIDKDALFPRYFVTLILIQILYVLATSRRTDRSFASAAGRYLKSAVLSLIFSVIIWLALCAILFSIRSIFDVWSELEMELYVITQALAFGLCLPLLFLFFKGEDGGENRPPAAAFRFLLDYILSPALLIYAVILYVYMLKIIFTVNLPKGQIAYMVTAFVTAFFCLKACQLFLERQIYAKFYRRASLITLPTLIICWVGVIYRIQEYGFTVMRVYLVIFVAVLTLLALLFFFRRIPHYAFAAWASVGLFGLITYVPGITAADIEAWSQSGRPQSEAPAPGETLHIQSGAPVDIAAYRQLYPLESYPKGNYYETNSDTLSIYIKDSLLLREDFNHLFARQLEHAGLSPTDSIPERKYAELLCLPLDSGAILFEYIALQRTDTGYHVNYLVPKYYLSEN